MCVLAVSANSVHAIVRIARLLPKGGELVCVGVNDLAQSVALQILELAHLTCRVKMFTGSLQSLLQDFVDRGIRFDFCLFDQPEKSRFLSDLGLCEQKFLLKPGAVIAANGSSGKAAVENLKHMLASGNVFRLMQSPGFREKDRNVPGSLALYRFEKYGEYSDPFWWQALLILLALLTVAYTAAPNFIG